MEESFGSPLESALYMCGFQGLARDFIYRIWGSSSLAVSFPVFPHFLAALLFLNSNSDSSGQKDGFIGVLATWDGFPQAKSYK